MMRFKGLVHVKAAIERLFIRKAVAQPPETFTPSLNIIRKPASCSPVFPNNNHVVPWA